jgi:hypothetical protein
VSRGYKYAGALTASPRGEGECACPLSRYRIKNIIYLRFDRLAVERHRDCARYHTPSAGPLATQFAMPYSVLRIARRAIYSDVPSPEVITCASDQVRDDHQAKYDSEKWLWWCGDPKSRVSSEVSAGATVLPGAASMNSAAASFQIRVMYT